MNKTLLDLILNSSGKFLTIDFIKKDGTPRTINGRLGVTKYLKGGTRTTDPNKFLVVYSNDAAGYRAIKMDSIKAVRMDGLRIEAGV